MYDEEKLAQVRDLRFRQGLPVIEVARRMGIQKQHVNKWLSRLPDYQPPAIYPSKREYMEHKRMTKAEYEATRSPWIPEDGIIDEVAIRRVVENSYCPVRVSENEAREIIKILSPRGVSDTEIARRVGAAKPERISALRDSLGIERPKRNKNIKAVLAVSRSRGKEKYRMNFGRGRKVA